jgi:hypothetical protein
MATLPRLYQPYAQSGGARASPSSPPSRCCPSTSCTFAPLLELHDYPTLHSPSTAESRLLKNGCSQLRQSQAKRTHLLHPLRSGATHVPSLPVLWCKCTAQRRSPCNARRRDAEERRCSSSSDSSRCAGLAVRDVCGRVAAPAMVTVAMAVAAVAVAVAVAPAVMAAVAAVVTMAVLVVMATTVATVVVVVVAVAVSVAAAMVLVAALAAAPLGPLSRR